MVLRKKEREKKRKETFTEPSLFTFGEEVAWGPRGASRLQFDGAVRGRAEAYSWKGDVEPCRVYCPGGSPTPDASTWNECNGLHLVRDWGVHGGDAEPFRCIARGASPPR